MKRIAILLFSVFIWSSPVTGQTKLNAQQQETVIQRINAASSHMNTMQCDFVQTKKMKLMRNEMRSNGTMYYASPNKLRWEYTSPYSYIFILNGDRVSIKSANNTQQIDTKGNKMFRQISDIILNSVTGGHLKSSADFDVELWVHNGIYTAKLLPKKKELKSMYDTIELVFNEALTMVETVTMVEKTGDVTIVRLSNTKINKPINEGIFAIR